jgi:hypothetical protein
MCFGLKLVIYVHSHLNTTNLRTLFISFLSYIFWMFKFVFNSKTRGLRQVSSFFNIGTLLFLFTALLTFSFANTLESLSNTTPYGILSQYTTPVQPVSYSCLNVSLLESIKSRYSLKFSPVLGQYARFHKSRLERISTFRYYFQYLKEIYGASEDIADSFTDSTRWPFWQSPEWYQLYEGDVLASIETRSRFAFFPFQYSSTRFKNTTKATEV